MKRVTVVGCGIVGLTTARALQEKGFNVKLMAEKRFDETLSSKVGAIWFPYEVHPIVKANVWASNAYNKYQREIEPGNGVSFIPFMVVFSKDSDTSWTKKLPQDAVRLAKQNELPFGVENAYIAQVPLAEPPVYLPFLFQQFIEHGGVFEQRTIFDFDTLKNLDTLVVNCTGLGAKSLCNDDELHPMRGQILRCEKSVTPSCVNSTHKGALSYVIQRSTDCIIGGTDYDHDWNEEIEQSDTDLILERLMQSGLSVIKPTILESLVGLRPKRAAVRFEFDAVATNVFHNYGHGGAGFTVAWGCALELAEIMNAEHES